MSDYSITAVTRRKVYSGSAGTGPYAFTFPIIAQTDIAVYKDATKLTLTTDYTVTINSSNGTGSVTLVVAATSSNTITIIGARAIERTTDFVTAGDLAAASLNEQLDAQIIMIQQLAEENKRTIKAPAYDLEAVEDGGLLNMILPTKANRAGKVMAFDTDGNPVSTEEIGDYKGNWSASTSYAKRDLVKDTSNSNIYRCKTAHTSSGSQPISSNTDSAKWDLIVDAAAAASSASAAATSATAAASSASSASTSATNAASSASSASTSASTATTQASNASTSATNAASSATSAASSATSASASAAAAAASAASGLYRQVLDKSANYTILAADGGTLFRVDTTSGAITLTLPAISTVTDGFKVSVVKWTNDANVVNINRAGSDTINGATTSQIGSQYSQITFVADFETNTWFANQSGLGATNKNVDVFSGNGSTTAFTLTSDPSTKNNMHVYISGVYQYHSTYSQSGTTLTFTTAPPSGTNNIEVWYGTPLAVGVPSDNTITDVKVNTASKLYNRINEIVSVKDFGAIGNGVADDTAAIQSALNSKKRIDFGDSTNTYKITSSLDLSAGNFWLSGSGATIDATGIAFGNKWAIKAVGGLSATTTLLTANASATSYSISVTSASGFAADDWVLLASNDRYDHYASSTTATVTISIASPGVVTWNSHGLSEGYPVSFTTTGSLPTGLTAGTEYYVRNPTTNTFQLATTRGGTVINTSGTQSGVHTATGDNYPVATGEFLRIRSIVGTTINFTTPISSAGPNGYTTAKSASITKAAFVENINISGLTIKGSNTAAANERGIVLQYVNNFDVSNCTFNYQDIYQLELTMSIKGNVTNNKFYGVYYDGVTGSIFYGITLVDSSQYINIGDNIFERVRHGAVTVSKTWGQSGWGQPLYINIHHNQMLDAEAGGGGRSWGFEHHGFGKYISFNNNMVNGGYGGVNVDAGYQVEIFDNVFTNIWYVGIELGSTALKLGNIFCSGNKISTETNETAVQTVGVRLDNVSSSASDIIISNNFITGVDGNTSIGVYLNSGTTTRGVVVKNNSIVTGASGQDGDSGYGITSYSSEVDIIGNTVMNYRQGIYNQGAYTTIKNNIVKFDTNPTTGFGIYNTASNVVIDGNLCVRTYSSIYITATSTNSVVTNNVMKSYVSAGLTDLGTTTTKVNNN